MPLVDVIVIAVVAVLAALFLAGYLANARRRRAEDAALRQRAQQADQHLALAHAEDKGWERRGLEGAARDAYAARHGSAPRDLTLVQVVDRPGVEEDEAVFVADGREIVLTRRGGAWAAD